MPGTKMQLQCQLSQHALSRHRLDQIKPVLRELTTEDKKSLVALLTDQEA